jgi:hypothetical protein
LLFDYKGKKKNSNYQIKLPLIQIDNFWFEHFSSCFGFDNRIPEGSSFE